MSIAIEFSDEFLQKVSKDADARKRSIAEQIEHYYKVTSIGIDNPDLGFAQICQIIEELKEEATEEYN